MKPRPIKSPIFYAGLAALILGALPVPAFAQKDLAQSASLQAAVNSVSESLTEDAPAKDTLLKILDLTLAEIQDLSTKDKFVKAIEDADIDVANLAQADMDALQNNNAYIETLKQQVSDESDPDTVQTMAADFKQWRTEVHEPSTDKVLDLLLFLQARAVLGTANSRLALISADVKTLNAVASKTDAQSLASLLASSRKNLQNAAVSLANAKASLLTGQSDALRLHAQAVSLIISQTYKKNFLLMGKIAQKYEF